MPYLILTKTNGTGAPLGGGVTTPQCTAPHFLDNTYWTNPGNRYTWNATSSVWEGGLDQVSSDVGQVNILTPIGSWATGYQPTNWSFTFYKSSSGSPVNFVTWTLHDTSGALLGTLDFSGGSIPYDTWTTLSTPITVGANDIGSIRVNEYLYNSPGDLSQIGCINFT